MNNVNVSSNLLPPAQLWIGSHEELSTKAEQFLQQQFCLHHACGTCTTCRLIRQRQFHAAVWLYPEKRYTLEQIKVIFDTISFALAPGQQFFFIVQKADCLTTACSNSLLKSVEEPPTGYHFIFLTERKNLILPTIRSRCTVNTYQISTAEHEKDKLLNFFKASSINNPVEFTKVLDTLKPNEQESVELLDNLFTYWMNTFKKAIAEGNKKLSAKAQHKLDIIKKALLKPPMPGSSVVFWKNMFLEME